MVYAVRDLMQGAYPELIDSADRVDKVVKAEEQQFDRVLKAGSDRLESELAVAVWEKITSILSERVSALINVLSTIKLNFESDRGLLEILRYGSAHRLRTIATTLGAVGS
jgi:hypothetical protein